MRSIRGFRCGVCRAEVLAFRAPAALPPRAEWSPPILCCGQPLRPIEPDQIPLPTGTRGRLARCPRCGSQVHLIVHPAGPLVCMLCQTEFAIGNGHPGLEDPVTRPVDNA